jgi:hypothetical protein
MKPKDYFYLILSMAIMVAAINLWHAVWVWRVIK